MLDQITQYTDQVMMWWGYASTIITIIFTAGFHFLGRVKAAVAQTPSKADDLAVAKFERVWNLAWRVFQAFSTYKGVRQPLPKVDGSSLAGAPVPPPPSGPPPPPVPK